MEYDSRNPYMFPFRLAAGRLGRKKVSPKDILKVLMFWGIGTATLYSKE